MRMKHGEMSFHHLYGFNLDILENQCLDLSINHDTIIARIFKATYYPTWDFFVAKLGHSLSFIWRSIHTSQVVVQRGRRCAQN